MDTDSDDEFFEIFLMAIFAYKQYKELVKQRRKKRHWSIRPLNIVRLNPGYTNLFSSMELMDEEQYLKYICMNKSDFTELLSLVSPKLQKIVQEKTISPKTILAITL